MMSSIKAVLVAVVLLSPVLSAGDKDDADRMRKIVHAHRQLYGDSCIPMAVELLLQLTGRVPSSFYDLQREWKQRPYGTFDTFVDRSIAGITFQKRYSMPRCPMFPFKGLFAAIDTELDAGRFVIIGLMNDERSAFHAWVIVERLPGGEYRGFSKSDALTLEATDIKRRIIWNGGTEIGTYTCDEEAPNKSPEPTPTAVTPPATERKMK